MYLEAISAAISKTALPVSSVVGETGVMATLAKGVVFNEIVRLATPKPRESRIKAVIRMSCLSSALACKGEANR